MIVTIVNIFVKPEHIDKFIAASADNHTGSVKEPGNMRFDVLQSREDPTHFVLYEAYISDEASAVHKATSHYLKWKETVAPWMAKPREGLPCNIICPTDLNRW